MKRNILKYSLALILVLFTHGYYAQISGLNPGVSAGNQLFSRNTDGNLSKIIREAGKSRVLYDGETVGSPYPIIDFIPAQIYYSDEYVGTFLIRYNAWRGQMEIKETNDPDEVYKVFLVDKNIHLVYNGHLLKFRTFIDDKGSTINAYLTTLIDSQKYTLYRRLAVKFSEGKAAVNSMVNPIPSRFTHFTDYYFSRPGEPLIQYVHQRRKKFIAQFPENLQKRVKTFLKEAKIDLKSENDLINTFNYVNTL